MRRILLYVLALIAIAAAIVLIGVQLTSASAQPASPSPSPSASPTPSPAATSRPPSHELIDWARHWHWEALRAHRQLARVRRCLGQPHPLPVAKLPPCNLTLEHVDSAEVWRQAGRQCRHQARNWAGKIERGIWKMKHPGGSGCERWRPLVRWVWPASCVDTVLQIMRRESHGNPRVLCGGYVLPKGAGDGKPDRRAGGLMQNKPAPRHWADPEFNLRYAFRHKYLPALRAWGNGWLPWAASGAVG